MSEWIAMYDQYPPYGESVLTTDGKSHEIRKLVLRDGVKMWLSDARTMMMYSASHWMPLPEVPK